MFSDDPRPFHLSHWSRLRNKSTTGFQPLIYPLVDFQAPLSLRLPSSTNPKSPPSSLKCFLLEPACCRVRLLRRISRINYPTIGLHIDRLTFRVSSRRNQRWPSNSCSCLHLWWVSIGRAFLLPSSREAQLLNQSETRRTIMTAWWAHLLSL